MRLTSGLAVLVLLCGVAALLVAAGCNFLTDAATRMARDVVSEAKTLRASDDKELTFEHLPSASPEGCGGAYTVTFSASPDDATHGALLLGCKGSENYARYGSSYGTTFHLNAVRVPVELTVEKPAGEPVKITLRKNGDEIDVVRVE